MSDLPEKKQNGPVRSPNSNPPDFFAPFKPANVFFEFRHSYKSIEQAQGKTRIRAVENRFTDGKVETERFEATLGGELYHDTVKQVWNLYANMFSRLMDPSWFFNPFMQFFPERQTRKPDKT